MSRFDDDQDWWRYNPDEDPELGGAPAPRPKRPAPASPGAALVLSEHARLRRKQMRVTEHRIQEAVADPDSTYPGPPCHGPDRTCFQRGDLVVVVNDRTGHVLTVLWHGREGR